MSNFFSVAHLHADDAPPVPFFIPVGGGSCTHQSTIDETIEWTSNHPIYTVGYEGNPDHLWEIVDFAVAESLTVAPANHSCSKFVVFYYSPINKEQVAKDCL